MLFSSNPRGHNEEGWNNGRYGVYHDPETWRAYVTDAGFAEITHYYRPPGLPREQQPWLRHRLAQAGFLRHPDRTRRAMGRTNADSGNLKESGARSGECHVDWMTGIMD